MGVVIKKTYRWKSEQLRSWSALFTKANAIAADKLKIKLEDIAITL